MIAKLLTGLLLIFVVAAFASLVLRGAGRDTEQEEGD